MDALCSPLSTTQGLHSASSLSLDSWCWGSVSVPGFPRKSIVSLPLGSRRDHSVVRASLLVKKEAPEARTALLVIGTRGRESGCENCPFFKMEDQERVVECTTPKLNGLISEMDLSWSWAAR